MYAARQPVPGCTTDKNMERVVVEVPIGNGEMQGSALHTLVSMSPVNEIHSLLLRSPARRPPPASRPPMTHMSQFRPQWSVYGCRDVTGCLSRFLYGTVLVAAGCTCAQ